MNVTFFNIILSVLKYFDKSIFDDSIRILTSPIPIKPTDRHSNLMGSEVTTGNAFYGYPGRPFHYWPRSGRVRTFN